MKKLLLLFALFVTACATTPISPQLAQIVPPERVLYKELVTSSSMRNIKVTITRDKGFTGSGVYEVFKIDGKDVANFNPGETLTVYLKKGDYLFGVIPSPNLFGTHTLEETDVLIKASRANNFRILTSADMISKVKRTSH